MVLFLSINFSDPASLIFFQWEESGSASMIQVNWLNNVIDLAMKNDSKFLHIDGLVHQYYDLSMYLSILTRMPPIVGVQYLLEYYMLVFFVKTQFWIWIWDS